MTNLTLKCANVNYINNGGEAICTVNFIIQPAGGEAPVEPMDTFNITFRSLSQPLEFFPNKIYNLTLNEDSPTES